MQSIYLTAEIREIEQTFAANNPGVSLMERAGFAAAEKACAMLANGFRVLVVCGPGNNGGDGLVVARHLLEWGYQVTTVLFADVTKLPTDAKAAYTQFTAQGGTTTAQIPTAKKWDLIIDALFGIGLARPLEGSIKETIEWINASGSSILALDIPSGLASDTGNVRGVAIKATETITFIGLKAGLLTADAKDHAGSITVASLEINPSPWVESRGQLLDQSTVIAYLPQRRADSHKGSFGSLGIVGGAKGMQGAVALAGRAALKLGAGRVYVGMETVFTAGYDPTQPELMWRRVKELLSVDHLNAMIAGPGMGQSDTAKRLLTQLIRLPLPILLDADALNLIAAHESLQMILTTRQHPTLLTPHPAEAARLLQSDTATVQSNRVAAALKLARQFNAMVVLKGAGSICALSDGRWYINPTGNPGMASAGMGDVLSGMIGALMVQGLAAAHALQLGVYLHGAAADALVVRGIGPVGLTASEIIDEARQLINQWVYTPNNN